MKTSRTVALALFTAAATLAGAAYADADAGLTRAQVKAELARAQQSGDVIDYETGRKLNELFPGAYAAKPATADEAFALTDLPPTAAGPVAVQKKNATVGAATLQGASSGAPWDYEAISQRNAEALAHGHGSL